MRVTELYAPRDTLNRECLWQNSEHHLADWSLRVADRIFNVCNDVQVQEAYFSERGLLTRIDVYGVPLE